MRRGLELRLQFEITIDIFGGPALLSKPDDVLSCGERITLMALSLNTSVNAASWRYRGARFACSVQTSCLLRPLTSDAGFGNWHKWCMVSVRSLLGLSSDIRMKSPQYQLGSLAANKLPHPEFPVKFKKQTVSTARSSTTGSNPSASDETGNGVVDRSKHTNRTHEWTRKAAFFDVDGTVTRTNVVMAGRSVSNKSEMASLAYNLYYKQRIYPGALEQINQLKQLGYHIVLVTGALDFQIAPLAQSLGADFVYAAELAEEDGRYPAAVLTSFNCGEYHVLILHSGDLLLRFTGKLKGMATSNSEKAERVLDYAERFDISLVESVAYGDSIADIPMLEMVGKPYAVNPDARLLTVALQRKWNVLNWNNQSLQATGLGPSLASL